MDLSIDAAASGSELELEVVRATIGFIVGWDGDKTHLSHLQL